MFLLDRVQPSQRRMDFNVSLELTHSGGRGRSHPRETLPLQPAPASLIPIENTLYGLERLNRRSGGRLAL